MTQHTRIASLAILATTSSLVMFAGVSQDRAVATAYPYEQTVCWEMDAPDLTNPASYEWPQHKVDCSVVPPASSSVCGTAAKYQVDTYWIRDDADRDYLAGMTTMSSPADDASLEPHGYYAVLVTERPAADCATPTPAPTPEPSPSVTPTPTPTVPVTPDPTPTNPPRDCRENPVTCEPTTKPQPPTVGPPPTFRQPPARKCIDENTIKVTHSVGTVDFINDAGVCDHDVQPPAVEEGF